MSVKVGDKIRVTNAYPDFPYKVGDIFEVSETYANSHAVGVKEGYYVGGGMFEIITNEEVDSMKAQKGDLIRITNVPEDWAYEAGGIYEVMERFSEDDDEDYKMDGVKFIAPNMDEDTVNYYAYDNQYVIHRKAGEEDIDGDAGACASCGAEVVDFPDNTEGLPYKQFLDAGPADAVNPLHYKQGRVEVIDIIEDAVAGADPFEAVCQANVLKYALRYRHKNGVEDLKKAVWYAEKLITHLDAKSTQDKTE